MFRLLLILIAMVSGAYAQDTRHALAPGDAEPVVRRVASVDTHASSYDSIADSAEIMPGRCYKGGEPPNAGLGWHEMRWRNDYLFPVALSVGGFGASVWQPMQMLAQVDGKEVLVTRWATTRVISVSGSEHHVLRPGETCHMVLPDASYGGTERVKWDIVVTPMRPNTAKGRFEVIGTEGAFSSVKHKVGQPRSCSITRFMKEEGEILTYSLRRCSQ